MTTLLDPTRSLQTTSPTTTAFPPARRSDPNALRTAVIGPWGTDAAAGSTGNTGPRRSRRRAALVGATLTLVGLAVAIGVAVDRPALAPLPPPAVSSSCTAGACHGLDPTTQGCQQDARTVVSRVVTAERRGVEIPVGFVEVRGSAACGAVWARYTLDPAAPVGEVAIETRTGTSEHAPVDALAGHRHLGYGTTPMLAVSADSARAVVIPSPGGELPSRATAWTG